MKLWDIIVNSTDIAPEDIQKDVFFWNEGNPCPQPAQLNASLLEPCSYLQGFDYFEVSFDNCILDVVNRDYILIVVLDYFTGK